MNRRSFLIAIGFGMAVTACASEQREWMKVGEKYTKAEFVRDYTDCSKGGKLDEACMQSRGWVAVQPPKPDQKAQPESYREERGRRKMPGQPGY